jgi:DNA (cytosine-5)-methyltransferase 1
MFAGIGGICLGFKNNGCEIVWANEVDKYACETYRHNFNGAPYLVEDDIRNIDEKTIPDFDILTGGFPCQAFSIAGERKGFEDDRGNLFFEIVRVLKEKKPKAFLLENVKNLKSHDKGRTYEIIEKELRKLGYEVDSAILNSMTHGNIPQNRERIFIVGFLDKSIMDKFEFPGPIKLTKTIQDLIDLDEKKPEKYYYHKTKYYEDLKKEMTRQDTLYQIRRGMYIRENKSNVCPTLTANMGTGGHNVPLIKDNHDIRKLTPEECLLFQGFNVETHDCNHTFPEYITGKNGKKRIYPDGPKYKQAGNCVTVTVIERIAQNMIKAMADSND